jgi:hypothetical protein
MPRITRMAAVFAVLSAPAMAQDWPVPVGEALPSPLWRQPPWRGRASLVGGRRGCDGLQSRPAPLLMWC